MSRKHTQFLNDVYSLWTWSLLPMILGMGLGIYSNFEIPLALGGKAIMAFIIIFFGPIIFDVIINWFSVDIKDRGGSIVLMSAAASVVGFIFSSFFNSMIIEYKHRVFIMSICVAITIFIIFLASVMAPKIRQIVRHFEEFSSVFRILFICCLLVFLLKYMNLMLWVTTFCAIFSFYRLFSAINRIHYIAEGNGDGDDAPICIAIYSFFAASRILFTVILVSKIIAIVVLNAVLESADIK